MSDNLKVSVRIDTRQIVIYIDDGLYPRFVPTKVVKAFIKASAMRRNEMHFILNRLITNSSDLSSKYVMFVAQGFQDYVEHETTQLVSEVNLGYSVLDFL